MAIKPCAVGRHSAKKQDKAFMGGVDLRAGLEAEDDPYAPQRLDKKAKKKRFVFFFSFCPACDVRMTDALEMDETIQTVAPPKP